MKEIASHPDVRMVSVRQLVEWLEVQDPAVLRKLRTLNPGEKPAGGWEDFLGVPSTPSHSVAPTTSAPPSTPATSSSSGA
jgi:hypothetical protein